MKIPVFDLKKQHLSLKKELYEALERVTFENSAFVLGKEIKEFEEDFAKYCGKDYCVGVGNGTDALKIVMRALDIGEGDEVIAPANTAIPTISSIIEIGAKPVLVDVKEDYLINPNLIKKAITSKTKAIIPVHLYGNPCDMDEIFSIAQKNNLKVIEDCAQSHGAKYKEKKVPVGDIGCFSFYPSKNLGALGDGGAIITNDSDLEKKSRILRFYGQSDRYNAELTGGFNTRLSEIQAAFLKIKLPHLDEWNSLRTERATLYSSLLENCVSTPITDSNKKPAYHLYVIRTENREGLMDYLKEKGIGTLIHYPIPIHLQKAFFHLGYQKGDFPNSEKFAKEIVSIPMYPELELSQVEEVANEIKNFNNRIN